ncbi:MULTISPECIES: NACHT domain-containing protein [unclassified Streptomyces]|uniref:NACHT domain-containing protein n=1 Tax=unclassified Streptomyces TaxID=2593676 RepID=UPI0036E35375
MFTLNHDEQVGTRGGVGMSATDPQTAAQQDHGEALERLAEQLRRLRAERRIAVSALAGRAGLSRTTVSKALNGASVPTEETVIALARELSADSEQLLELRRHALPAGGRAPRGPVAKASSAGDRPQEEVLFERRYLQYIENRWKKLSVIGLDADRPERSSWPLDVAYLSLSLSAVNEPSDALDPRPGLRRSPNEIRVEQALTERRRILVRGLAGCGKTTLLQWLAVTAARRNFSQELMHLNDCVPFFLRMRTITRIGRLPAPAGYLNAVGCQLSDDQPTGWADKVLAHGRGLVLIDGVDEVAQEYRDDTRAWLEELLAAYPDNQYIVTTRPAAVREGWLAHSSFSELVIHPMSPRDVAVFIDRWHKAAAVDTDVEDERIHLDALREKLKDTVRSQRGLAQMATSPLLSALVCALNRARNGHLPHGRMEIYEAALSMLLHRRDRERGIEAGTIRLSERQAMRLLQRLAYWMVDNGQAEISRYDALHHLSDAMPSLPEVAVQGPAEQILNHLVERSGLLRAPDDDSLDFIHRTFQDYLAARFAVERRNFGALVNHAHDDRWEDVIRMAVAHASPEDAQQLLRRLIARGDRYTSNVSGRNRMHLLAAACLDYATELAPDIRQEVRSRVEAVIPPKSPQEANELSKVGPVILDLLPGPDGLKSHEAEAVVHTAGLLGGDPSMTLLKRYRTYTKGQVPHYLQLHWPRHDIADYAREILSHNSNIDHLTISVPEQMDELWQLKIPTSVTFQGDFSPSQIAALPNATQVEWLTIGYNHQLEAFDVLEGFSKLHNFTLDICQGVKDASALNRSNVRSLSVWKANQECLRSLPRLTNLREFRLNSDSRSLGLQDFFPSSEVTSVYLGPMSCGSLWGISQWPTISDLAIASSLPMEGLVEFASLPKLRTLDVRGSFTPTFLERIPILEQVGFLKISEAEFSDLRTVVEKFPNLRCVNLSCKGGSIDVSVLREVDGLVVRVSGASEVRGR